MHPHPSKKGPALLVSTEDLDEANRECSDVCRVETVSKFLGQNLSIMENKIVASILPDSVKLMNFYAKELKRGLDLTRLTDLDQTLLLKIDENASLAISSFIESRIQNSITLATKETVCKLYSVHRFAVCAFLSFNTSFFGFKPVIGPKKPVENLFQYLESTVSKTYLTLCEIAGRPNIFELARRSASVAIDQEFTIFDDEDDNTPGKESAIPGREEPATCPSLRRRKPAFVCKMNELRANIVQSKYLFDVEKAKLQPLHVAWSKICGLVEKRKFVKIATDRFARSDLVSRGFDIVDSSCRICGVHQETIGHLLSCHAVENNIMSSKVKDVIRRPKVLGQKLRSVDFFNVFSEVGVEKTPKKRKLESSSKRTAKKSRKK